MAPSKLFEPLKSERDEMMVVLTTLYKKHQDVFNYNQVGYVVACIYAMAIRNEQEFSDKVLMYSHESKIDLFESLQYHYDIEIKITHNEVNENVALLLQDYLQKARLVKLMSRAIPISVLFSALICMAYESYFILLIISTVAMVGIIWNTDYAKMYRAKCEEVMDRQEYRYGIEELFPQITW